MKKHLWMSFVGAALTLGLAQFVSVDLGAPSGGSLTLGTADAEAKCCRFRAPRFRAPAFVRRAAAAIRRTATNVVRTATSVARKATSTVTSGIKKAVDTGKKIGGKVVEAGKKMANTVVKGVGQAFDKVKEGGKWLADKAKQGAKFLKEQAEKLKKLLKQVAELTKKLASFAKGEIAEVIKAFKGGVKGLVKYAANKLPGPAGKLVDALFLQGGSIMDRLKRAGMILLGDIKKLIDGIKNKMKQGIDKVVKPLLTKAKNFILDTVLKPAIAAMGGLLKGEIDKVIARVAGNILGHTEKLRGQLDQLGSVIDAVANGEQGVNEKLAQFGTSIDSLGKDIVSFALDYGLGWLRGKAVGFVMNKIQKLMEKVWSWAYKGVSIARNAVQGAVGTIPFVGGALAAALGLLIDEGWNLLKGKVDGFIEDSINKLADMAMNKAKSMLAGVADKAGGALQGFVNALRGPLGKISEQVRAKVMPILQKYRSVVAKLQTLAAK